MPTTAKSVQREGTGAADADLRIGRRRGCAGAGEYAERRTAAVAAAAADSEREDDERKIAAPAFPRTFATVRANSRVLEHGLTVPTTRCRCWMLLAAGSLNDAAGGGLTGRWGDRIAR